MNDMDLIPPDFRKRADMQRRIRNFGVACLVVMGAAGVARASLGYLTFRERAQMARLEQQAQALRDNQSKATDLRQQSQATEQQLAALGQLRGRDSLALFLRAVDQAYSEHIWLDSVRFRRHGIAGAQGSMPGPAPAGIAPPVGDGAVDLTHGAELFGHALNHTVLARFMQDLGTQPAVTNLRLISTAARNYTTTQVIDFNLSLQVTDLAGARP
jgi:hypothetical protein